jgi:acyl-CoA synthetase (AMP-forming)/AMP-acid ligase II
MNLLTVLDMAAEGHSGRPLLGSPATGLTAAQLAARARRGGRYLTGAGVRTLVYIGENGPSFPLALFAAAAAGIPFLPLNYRLTAGQLASMTSGQRRPLVIADSAPSLRPEATAMTIGEWEDLLASPACGTGVPDAPEPGPDDEAVLLMTSGTTAAPKSAVLRHRHLVSYILGSVDFGSAAAEEAALVSVPPYHIAAVTNLLSNLYRGRRIVYLERFTARGWLEAASAEEATHAMVVPTMLARIVDELEAGAPLPPRLRSLSYGGAPLSPRILARALALLPDVGFVNAYGLTETSSSVAVLGPEDHRAAASSAVPAVRARLGSVGRPLPGIEIEVRKADGSPCAPGQPGQIHVRGAQVAGEYRGSGPVTDSRGWFSTRDEGYIDDGGYLFVQGRADDTIIRGGENIAPAEIEAVIEQMSGVAQVAVAGLPSDEWGQQIGAFVVPRPGARLTAEQVRDFARARLRSSRAPDTVVFVPELPHTPTGKLLRRDLVRLAAQPAISPARQGLSSRVLTGEGDLR